MIETARLTLVPATPTLLEAALAGEDSLARAIGAALPADWPPEFIGEPAYRYTLDQLATAEQEGWWMYFVIERGESPTVVGTGGYKGPPVDGTVEVGYAVVESCQRRGIATEATRGWIDRAFADPRVDRVIGETMPDRPASIRVLEKLGFTASSDASEEGVLRFERRA